MIRPARAGLVAAVVLLSWPVCIDSPAFGQRDELNSLETKAFELYRAGKLNEAVPVTQQILTIREKLQGPDHPDVVTTLINLADLYRELGRYADAEPLYKRALAVTEKARGPDHPDVATALNRLGALYQAQGQYARAEPLYKQSLAMREKALPADHLDVAVSLSNLAELYRHEGRYAEAEPLHKRALAIFEKKGGPDSRDVALSLVNQAVLYREQGRYGEAEALYKRALPILEKTSGTNHPIVATALNNLAELYRWEGRYADAEPLQKRSLTIREKLLGRDHPDVAVSLNNLALIYELQGRYAEAEALRKRSLLIGEKALGPNHPDVAVWLNNLGLLYEEEGRPADAWPLYKRALAIREKALGPDHPDVAVSLNAMAGFYRARGRYDEAETLYKRSLTIREKTLGSAHPSVATALDNLAVLYLEQRRYADALPLVSATITRGRADPAVALPVLFAAQNSGLISPDRAHNDALNVAQRAAQSSAAAALNKLAVRIAAGSDRLASLVRQDQDLAAEAKTLDKAILAAVSNEPAKRDSAAEQRMRDRLAAIAKEREALQQVFAREFPDYAALSTPRPLSAGEIQTLLSDDEALLLYAPGNRDSSYVFALTRKAATWQRIALGADALGEKVAAFRHGLDVDQLRRSAKGGKPVLFDLGLAHDLYAALIGPVEAQIKDAKHLIIVPFGPLTSLPFHLLVTDKPAVAVPPLKDIATYRDAAWLIKRQAVSVLPAIASLKALRQPARREAGSKPMVGFGDPIFDPAERARALADRREGTTRAVAARQYGDFWQGADIDRAKLAQALASLLDTADELKSVAAKLGAPLSDIHLQQDASEATVKRLPLSDYRVVYFATHGLVAGDVRGLGEPALALTLPKQPSEIDDGLLTASEVAQLRLNADWVVLSACNTIAGDKPGAEALSGLARAFFYAGARALLVSHWAVETGAATRLTTTTFEMMNRDPKVGRAEAVRRAMLGYMNDRSDLWSAYPGYWGPFEVVGEGAAP
jgi:CHAT domain-containing protein